LSAKVFITPPEANLICFDFKETTNISGFEFKETTNVFGFEFKETTNVSVPEASDASSSFYT